MKNLFHLFIVIIITLFFSSCSNNNQQPVQLPPLYLEGQQSVYLDKTDVYETKKVKRTVYTSSCDSAEKEIPYLKKVRTDVDSVPFIAQGQPANIDSILASQGSGAFIAPVNPPNRNNNSYSGGGNYEGGNGGSSNFEIPAWLWELLGFLAAFALFCLFIWLIVAFIGRLRRGPASRDEIVNYNTNHHHHYNQPQQTGAVAGTQAPIVPVIPGQPQVQSTCMAGAPGSIIIPAPLAGLKEETITINRKY